MIEDLLSKITRPTVIPIFFAAIACKAALVAAILVFEIWISFKKQLTPNSMNSIRKPSFYFSAYPLKVIRQSTGNTEPTSPYLKALLSGSGKTRTPGKVLPMINPYNKQFSPAPLEEDKLPKDIELTEKDWFKHYE